MKNKIFDNFEIFGQNRDVIDHFKPNFDFFDTNGSFRIVIQCHYHLLAGKILYNRSFWLNRYLKVGDASLLTGPRRNPKSSINKGVRKFTLPCQLIFRKSVILGL